MMKTGNINFYGQLWQGRTSPAIRKALDETRRFAILKLKSRTPVKTGNLRDSWQVSKEAQGLRIGNSAKYAIYVEMGTRHMAARNMLTNSLPEIESTFKQSLAREIGKTLGAKIIASATGKGFAGSSTVGQTRAEKIATRTATPTYERLTGGS